MRATRTAGNEAVEQLQRRHEFPLGLSGGAPPTVYDILVHLREPTAPLRIASARGDAMGYTGDETRETKLPRR